MCVRESTATFPHILSPCRQRARVQSAPIYRGGKAAAAYLVEYLRHSRLAAAVLIALLRCDASTQRRRARARARSSARS